MRRASPWIMLAVLLLGILFLREPRLAMAEEKFLGWLLKYAGGKMAPVPLTVVEIGMDPLKPVAATQTSPEAPTGGPRGIGISPLEFALFLQSVLAFEPGVVAFENVLRWRERERDQEQIFLDQAMRVPKLLLAAELGPSAEAEGPWADVRGFTNVTGKRGDLVTFASVMRQPVEDLRLISTPGFINLPDEISADTRVPLLFLYRGEVVPSFPLQAIMLWEKVTAAEVKVVLGSHIELPRRRIPIRADGTMLIHPNAGRGARRMSMNELLLAAQEREAGKANVLVLKEQIVLARTPANPLAPPDRFAAAIATIQGQKFLRRVGPMVDYGLLVVLALASAFFPRIERFDLILGGVAATAAYALIALGLLSRWDIWIPGVLPLSALWLAILLALIFRPRDQREVSIPPPIA